MNAIQIMELTKEYGNRRVVDRLELSIPAGELFALLGVNGAGKSTTIKMLSCLTVPTEGDAQLMGHSVRTQSHQAKEILAVSPQETAVALGLTVAENLELMAGIYGRPKERAAQVMEQLGLTQWAKQRAKTLSGGWQRRLSIAMALVSQPEVLFLDEPTLGLDVLARRELWGVIRGLKGHTTIILTTHYLEEAESLADRIGIMNAGRLRAVGTAQELEALAGCDNFEDAFVALAGEEAAS
ncbi:MAG: ABC transporter ATP-binding protein [Oscillospiraceae bacterium]|nr:ABC transporter ATP-binding protein [Oscillospiraceae bacterium]